MTNCHNFDYGWCGRRTTTRRFWIIATAKPRCRAGDWKKIRQEGIILERRRISSIVPSPTGPIAGHRDLKGRWQQGNKAARGNPLAKQVQAIRVALVSAVTPKDIQAVIRRLLQQAKAGDVASAKIIFERAVGPAEALDFDLRLTELENQVLESHNKGRQT